ncbi:MAG: bifunctional pyr operon transcriptional regulator/uracil phosphoribosyltransferase PyrR [Myxococcales bacterium]|nr:bifunctional pyr operon transcriptional regulator/uracil phosphoribosyltransferase PyrR [Myxococcales bacterium]
MGEVIDRAALTAAVSRLADQLALAMVDEPRWALIGVRSGGVPLADALAEAVVGRTASRPERGDVDITLYRDDLYTGFERPVLGETNLPFEVNGCGLVLVDDVLFTGRTIRAALGEVVDYGRPAFVRLCVLVDRGHRELPIAPDFCGFILPTSKSDRVVVDWREGVVRVKDGPSVVPAS